MGYKEKYIKGEKFGRKACFSSWAKQNSAISLSPHNLLLSLTIFSLSLSFHFCEIRGV